MKYIKPALIKKLQSKVDNLERGFNPASRDHRCTKQIFIDRLFKFLNGRCFKLLVNDEVHYALFRKSMHRTSSLGHQNNHNQPNVFFSYGFRFSLGYSTSTYHLLFHNEKGEFIDKEVDYNDILRIRYKEISLKKYGQILKLFSHVEK